MRMNPVALITGASRGIGRGIAVELAKVGYDLVINYAANETAAKETAADCLAVAKEAGREIRAEICQADISKPEDRQGLVGFTKETFGGIDLLVNNAGVAPKVRADLLEATEESFDRLININVKGPYFLTQLVAREMVDAVGRGARRAHTFGENDLGSAGASPYQPKIVTITSVSAYTASVNRGDYCISKAALSMLTPLFAARLAEHDIGVYEIRPGIIATDMTGPVKEKYDQLIANGLTSIKRWGTPEDIGRAVAAIASGAFAFSTGEVINVDGGFHLRTL